MVSQPPRVARRRPLAPTAPVRPTPTPPPPAVARAALSEARRQRAEHLIAVAEGLLTPSDVIDAAVTEEGRPLRKITLRQVLLSQPGVGAKTVDPLLARLVVVAGEKTRTPKQVTVGWLIDARAGGRRLQAWLDVHEEKVAPAWSGFPYAGRPGAA